MSTWQVRFASCPNCAVPVADMADGVRPRKCALDARRRQEGPCRATRFRQVMCGADIGRCDC
eukprot:3530985-Rhodomonas_salina.1